MKRIISKIITGALALTIATNGLNALAFTDMKDTEETTLLTRLGIISGYEDGSFRPDNEVTRAEAAAVIVKSVGTADEDIEVYKEEMKKGKYIYDSNVKITDFNDYNPDYWANIYIQLGIENGFISGFEDNTFRPEDKVTVDQLITMLINAIGYNEFAKATGGYPNGYRHWASVAGILADGNMTDTDYGKNATRRQVADLVCNALDAPVCVISGYETTWDGRITPSLQIMDGEGKDYRTLAIYRHAVHTAAAKVTDIKSDTATVTILGSQNFDGETITVNNTRTVKLKLMSDSKNDIKQDDVYKMYIKIDDIEDNDYTLVYAYAEE